MAPNRVPIYRVNIADGFADDCEELIHRCIQQESVTYHSFCEVWKDMKFYSLFYGRLSGSELAELSEEVLLIAKQYMTADNSNFEESVAGLFLVYALLNLQPYSNFAAVRIVPEDVSALVKLESVARQEKRYDVLYILGAVLIRGPCQYHAAQRERGLETPIRKYLEGCMTIDQMGVRPKGVFFRQNEEMEVIRDLNSLNKRYSELKASLFREGQYDRNLMYTDEQMPQKLETTIKQVINGLIEEVNDDAQPVVDISEHYTAVQKIKEKAMKQTVDSVKHLTGVKQRKSKEASPKSDSELTSPTNNKDTEVPAKSETASPKSRKVARLKERPPRTKKIIGDANVDDSLVEILNADPGSKNDIEDEIEDTNAGNLLDLPELIPGEVPIENINKNVVVVEKGFPRSDLETVSEAHNSEATFKKPKLMRDKKNLKNALLKSKLKRLGMLKVADFQETK